MKYIFKTLIIAAALAFTATSCDDFLDTEQRGVTAQENFYKTDDDANQALMAIYYGLKSQPLNEFYLNQLSDDAVAGGGSASDNNQGRELDEFRISTTNSVVTSMYRMYYQCIYRANILIQKVSPDDDVKKLAVAEAKALRAFCYFQLVSFWGDVPLILEPLTAGNYSQARTPKADVYNQIESDLQEVIPVLPAKSAQSAADKARFSKGAAQTLLGKAYLFEEKFDKAAEILQTVINSREYSLIPDYKDIYRKSSEYGAESIFELGYLSNATYPLQGNPVAAYCNPRGLHAGTSGISESGWGFCIPSMELHDAFLEAGDSYRMRYTVLSDDEFKDLYGGTMKQSNADGSYWYYFESRGLVRTKNVCYLEDLPNQDEGYHVLGEDNMREFRYADVLLMAAEALTRKSSPDLATAGGYVNQVRERAKLADLDASLDQAGLFAAIKNERRFELAFENCRFRDLVRWGDAASVLGNWGKTCYLGTFTNGVEDTMSVPDAGFKSGRNELLPIPEAEMLVNKKMTQNPGY